VHQENAEARVRGFVLDPQPGQDITGLLFFGRTKQVRQQRQALGDPASEFLGSYGCY
jgi:hypothetical protein